MTQAQLIIKYIKEYGKFTPAIKANSAYMRNGIQIGWFGFAVDSVCRKLRLKGARVDGEFIKLQSHREGKFETFYIEREKTKEPERKLIPVDYRKANKLIQQNLL
jgi:hypothetical protein